MAQLNHAIRNLLSAALGRGAKSPVMGTEKRPAVRPGAEGLGGMELEAESQELRAQSSRLLVSHRYSSPVTALMIL